MATALLAPEGSGPLLALYKQMQQRCTTENKQLLIEAGTTSKGLQQDGSIWTRLCALAYCRYGDTAPDISTPIPRPHTIELPKNYDKLNGQLCLLSDGWPGSNIALTAEGTIVIRPSHYREDHATKSLSISFFM